ncbi:L-proline glycine betaine binding ABC transporter protein ProX [Paraburkholderia caribensis MBA4]|uniref:L-proline glycine betaine binding ABC transporter protein ProX n=1 Tax=Paraburkholderia caribensis MBA4 TaxID=1323664 RepID=A0A0N7JV53_9BURK|nr:ABC transporter substrate-binding protein [Paraburkholderia caribensis]ALL68253.1 L-proline glycine betaine binding ABC transporter protein ProX [Paraburkholderia caribensis MBA4]
MKLLQKFGIAALVITSNALMCSATYAAESITIGSANFPESQLLATIYASALEAKGIHTEKKLSIGSREVYMPALLDGSIDLIPEYAGSVLLYFNKATKAHSSTDVRSELPKVLPGKLVALPPSAAEDKGILSMTEKTANQYHVKDISDLAPHAKDFVIGGPPEMKDRHEGVPGLSQVYGLNFKSFKALDMGGPLTLNGLLHNQIQVSALNSTQPELKTKNLVALTDSKNLYMSQNVFPLIAKSKLTPQIQTVLDSVSAQLTTSDLISMNQRLTNLEPIDSVAKDWVRSHHLADK